MRRNRAVGLLHPGASLAGRAAASCIPAASLASCTVAMGHPLVDPPDNSSHFGRGGSVPNAAATKSRALRAAAYRTMGIGLHLHAPVCTCISSTVCCDCARVPQRTHRVARDARASRWRHDSAVLVPKRSGGAPPADPVGTRYSKEARAHRYLASLSKCACALPSMADQEPKRGDDSLLDYRSTRWTRGSLLYDGEPDFNRTRQLFQRHRILVCWLVSRGCRERSRGAVARLLP